MTVTLDALGAAFWILGLTLAAGLVIGCFYLQERPIRGWARLVSVGHGLLGVTGSTLFFASMAAGASDKNGMGQVAASLLAGTLVGAAVVVLAQIRRRRPSGMVVALHATLGVAGYVILAAYATTPH